VLGVSGRGHNKKGSVLCVLALFAGYAVVHSVLASFPAKHFARRWVGERAEKGLYRGFYIMQATATTVGAGIWFLRFPDRELYRVEGAASLLLRAVQLSGAALLLGMVKTVGVGKLTGLSHAVVYAKGGDNFPLIEAQGPPPSALPGQLDISGPFRYIRHPENLGFVLLLAGLPRMTVNRLTLTLLSLIYAVIGSWHEDHRLAHTYGEPFRRYRRRTPMLIPIWFRREKFARVLEEGQ
jgi:methanethiol S-methyltransferase